MRTLTVLTGETDTHDSYVKTCSSGDFHALALLEELHAPPQVGKMSGLEDFKEPHQVENKADLSFRKNITSI